MAQEDAALSMLHTFFIFVILAVIPSTLAGEKTESRKLIFIGDSLTEGYGISSEQAYPALIGQKIRGAKKPYEVINSSVSGSTSANAPSRVRWSLKAKPAWIVLALGANDALRGIDPEATEQNLREAIAFARAGGAKVLLVGMKAPPNMGAAFVTRFERVFPRLAKEFELPIVPFLLEGVATQPTLNLEDGIHPNPAGHAKMAETVWNTLKGVL